MLIGWPSDCNVLSNNQHTIYMLGYASQEELHNNYFPFVVHLCGAIG